MKNKPPINHQLTAPMSPHCLVPLPSAYSEADAWILLAVLYAPRPEGRPASLASIRNAADYIDHAIPTDEELSGALARLQSAGFIVGTPDGFSPTASTLAAYARTTTPRRTAQQELKDMRLLLGLENT